MPPKRYYISNDLGAVLLSVLSGRCKVLCSICRVLCSSCKVLIIIFNEIGAPGTRDGTLNPPRTKRQYVWAKTGGLCWYCGAQLYRREEADTEVQKRLVFTADHLHPRAHGGRGRANKVPACRYCNSHKSSRSVEQFRQWVQKLLFDKTKHAGRPVGEQARRRWKTNAEAVVFYFELARLPNSDLRDPS